MKARRGLSRTDLWHAIRRADLPGKRRCFLGWSWEQSFERRLQNRHSLTRESARRLAAEYRRFLYLKTIEGGLMTPSRRVDQAWHLHLETPGDSWGQFCKQVLHGCVEHRTGLSAAESKVSYARTLERYRREFGEEPPPDIWPGERERRRALFGRCISIIGLAVACLGGVPSVVDRVAGILTSNLHTFGLAPTARLPIQPESVSVAFVLAGFGILIIGVAVSSGTDLAQEAKCG